MPVTVQKITTVLAVEAVEPSLEFWERRLGLDPVTVPHEDNWGLRSC
jgi:hypothetical protein